MLRRSLALAALVGLISFLPPTTAQAQAPAMEPRFGGGFEAVAFVGNPRVIRDGLGIGIRGRVSFPVNADFSIAGDAGLIGFVLAGRDGALWVFNPQVSGILTLPALGSGRYILAGFGWAAPMGGGEAEGGPTIHGGIGWVIPLRETSLYIEFNPNLVIGQARTSIALPLRVGVIF